MKRGNIDLSFVILTWNSDKYINDCLDSIIFSLDKSTFNYEILVVDNGSQDKSAQIIKEYEKKYPSIMAPIFYKDNMGTTVSRNMALGHARGDYLCIMDSDVVIGAGVIETLVNEIESDSSIGLVAPKIFYPSGNWQKSTCRFPTLFEKINRFFNLKKMERLEATKFVDDQTNREVDYAISAMWLFKREVLINVGLLDEKIFYSPEDVDYCLRIWKAGYKIMYIQKTKVVHHTQEISRGLNLNKAKLSHIKGLFYLFFKHKYFFRSPDFKQTKPYQVPVQ